MLVSYGLCIFWCAGCGYLIVDGWVSYNRSVSNNLPNITEDDVHAGM